MTLSVALVGCGKIADGHVEEIQKQADTALVAVCDREPLMARQLAARFSVPRWDTDFAVLLRDTKPDVVHITTPPDSHLVLARMAFEAGCHVYLEKPMALRAEDAVEIVRLAQHHDRKLTINYWLNFEPQALDLRRLVDAGTLGEIVHVESTYCYSLGGAYGAAFLSDASHWLHKLPGKLFHNVLDHILNKIMLFLPDDQPRVQASAFRRRPARGDISDGVLDELRVMITGATTTAYATLSCHATPSAHLLRVCGTKATAQVDFGARTIVLEQAQTLPSALGRLFPPFATARAYRKQAWANVGRFRRSEFHYFAGMASLMTQFYDAVRTNQPLPVAYRDMTRVAEVMDAIFRQVHGGPQ